jgi:hypothetical protein
MGHLVIFQYTNAYDVYSAEALNALHYDGVITDSKNDADGYYLWCDNLDPVLEVMKEYGFTYEVFENIEPEVEYKSTVQQHCYHLFSPIGNIASMCSYCGKIKQEGGE